MFLETVVLENRALLTVELHGELRYRLCYAGEVEYTNGRRRIRGRVTPYEFRSVEQLRYDFEEDVRRLAESA